MKYIMFCSLCFVEWSLEDVWDSMGNAIVCRRSINWLEKLVWETLLKYKEPFANMFDMESVEGKE